MSCLVHFDPRNSGSLVCSCGWTGGSEYADYQWSLVGSDVKEPVGWELTAKGRVPLKIEEHDYEPITAEADALADTLPVTRKRKEDKRVRPESQNIGEEQLWSCHCPKCGASLKEDGMLVFSIKNTEKIDWLGSALAQAKYHTKDGWYGEGCGCELCKALRKRGLKDRNGKGGYIPFTVARARLRAITRAAGKPIDWAALYVSAREVSEKVYADRKRASKKWVKPVPEVSTIRSATSEIRLASEPSFSVWQAERYSSALFFEVDRALVPPRGKAPEYDNFKDENEYFEASAAYKAEGRKYKYAQYSIEQLYNAKRDINPDTAYERCAAILDALGIEPLTDVSCKFQLVAMASKVGDTRKKASVALAKRMGLRHGLKQLMERALEKGMEEVGSILFGLYEEFGDVLISNAAARAIQRDRFAMWSVRSAGYGVYEKKTYKYKDWMEEHPEFYESMEYSMDRGGLETTEDGSVWIYDSVRKEMQQVFQGMEREPNAMGRGQSSWKLIDLVPFSDDWQGGQLEERQEEEGLEFYDPEGEGEEVEAEVEVASDLEDSAVA